MKEGTLLFTAFVFSGF